MKFLTIAAALCAVTMLMFSDTSLAKKMPSVQQGPNAEVTFDGLHLVDKTRMDKAWIKPDIDLSHYDAVMFEGAGIQYRATKKYSRHNRNAESFPLSDKQKVNLEKAVRESFQREFEKFEHFKVTDTPGAGTLKVTLALIDVVSRVPPEPMGRSSIYLRDLGQAVLVIEIRDSVTNEALARVVDGQRIEPMMAQESNPVTNTSEVRRSVRKWGSTIRKRLDELHELGCYVCNVPGPVE